MFKFLTMPIFWITWSIVFGLYALVGLFVATNLAGMLLFAVCVGIHAVCLLVQLDAASKFGLFNNARN